MNSVDYTKKLAKEREYFNDTIQKNRDAADRKIADNNERTEGIINKQRDVFIKEKSELEDSYQKNLNQLNEKSLSSLDNDNKRSHEEMLKEREQFTKDSLMKRKDFDQRLKDIKSSYQTAFDSEKDIHEDIQKTSTNRYNESVSEINKNADKNIKQYQQKVSDTGAKLNDDYKRERQQLVRNHEDQLTQTTRDSNKKRIGLENHYRDDLGRSRESQKAEHEDFKRYTDGKVNTIEKKYDSRVKQMSKDYSERSDKLVQTQQRDALKINREHQKNVADINRDHGKQMQLVELQRRRQDNGSGEFAEFVNRQQGAKDQAVNELKIKYLKDKMSDVKQEYQTRAQREQDAFNDSLKSESVDATARLDRKMNQANADKIVSVSKEREKAEAQVATRENQNLIDRQSYEQKLMVERNNANSRLTKLKRDFTASMTQLEEKHKANISEVTKVNNSDKADYLKRLNESHSKDIAEMKREFSKLMDTTIQEYELRLGNYQRDNEYLKMAMDQKVQSIMEQTGKEVESQREIYEDRRAADLTNYQLLLDEKDRNVKSDMISMNNNFQKKIDKLQLESDSKLKLITSDYENKLRELRTNSSKELAQKDSIQQIELERLKSTYRDEKARLVSTYEEQLKSVKNDHVNQMNQMKDFKRLS
jgi:hypothetical protein